MTQLQDGPIPAAPAFAVDLATAINEAVRLLLWTGSLRRDRDAIMARYRADTASEQDLHRYRTIRLALNLYDSPARRPYLPRSVDETLRRHSELIMEEMVGLEVAGPQVAS